MQGSESKAVLDWAAAEEAIAGGVTARRGDAVMVRGEGCWLWDSRGRRYLDLGSAQGVALLGHSPSAVSAAVAAQAGRLMACPNFFYSDIRAEFLLALSEILPVHLGHVFLANSGAEAIEGALKFARLATGRTGFVAASRAFHGRTAGALSVTWEPKYRKPFLPLLDVEHVPYNNPAALERAIHENTAAVVLECVQGEGGVHVGTAEFLHTAQRLCRERGALLILDEIQTGFGRTGRWFAAEHFGLAPDILCLAKGLGAGFPIGAIAYSQKVHAALYFGAHGSTFGGGPLACAAGLAALQEYQAGGWIAQAAARGDELRAALDEALTGLELVREVRSLGLMVGIELRQKAGPYLRALMEEHGVIALPAGGNVLRLLPPLIIDRAEIELGVAAIAAVLRSRR